MQNPFLSPDEVKAIQQNLAAPVVALPKKSTLKEMVRYGYACEEPQRYFKTLCQAMEAASSIHGEARRKIGDFIREAFTWKSLALRWDALLL